MIPIVADGKVIGTQKQSSDITMTQEAWGRYNEIEQTLTQIGADSGPELRDQMIPMNVRLAVSILKCAMLLATARTKAPPVEIDVEDILRAASYGDTWRRYAQDVIINVGKGPLEHKITLVMNAVIKNSSMPRSRVMQTYHLTAREMDDIEKTLIGRGLITRGGEGRGTTYNSLME